MTACRTPRQNGLFLSFQKVPKYFEAPIFVPEASEGNVEAPPPA